MCTARIIILGFGTTLISVGVKSLTNNDGGDHICYTIFMRKNVEEMEKNNVVHGGNKSGKAHTHTHKYTYMRYGKRIHCTRTDIPEGIRAVQRAVEVYIGGVGRGR